MLNKLSVLVDQFKQVLIRFPEVKYVGDPVLRRPTEKVTVEEGVSIGERLGEVLLRYRKDMGYGRGFAAPQLGLNKAVFVTFVEDELEVFINPKIVETAPTTNFYRELCLSSGMMAVDVERPEWIVMEWTAFDGKTNHKRFDGFLARLHQHEVAHLRGKLNLDEATAQGIEFALFDPLQEKLRSSRH